MGKILWFKQKHAHVFAFVIGSRFPKENFEHSPVSKQVGVHCFLEVFTVQQVALILFTCLGQ